MSRDVMRTCYVIPPEVPFVVGILLACVISGSSHGDVFDDVTNAGMLQRLVVDRNSGRVFVGAMNRLYQLSGALELEATVVNGPKEDNPNCPPPTSECQCFNYNCKDFEKTEMDSVSKALVIDYRGERLISCVNLYQGHCDKHLLTDIRQKDNAVWTMLVPNDEESPVVMFVAPGPPNPASTDVLYVAATRSMKGLAAYKDIVPAICMRSLQDLNFVSDDILMPSRIEIEVQQRDLFRVQYVYGFESVGFSYFLMVQKPSLAAESEQFVTHMSRICQKDKSLYSYTEVPLECRHKGVHYNILRTAFISYPGTNLAKNLSLPHIAPLTDMEHVLVAVFTNQSSAKALHSSSAMCVYPMRDIRRMFTETIQKCFQGTGNTGPDHFVPPKPCLTTPLEILDDYCGQHDINHPIKGTDPVLGQAVIVWDRVNVTSVVVTRTTDFTVAFVGTEDGHVKKVTIESQQSATEYASILIERNSSIRSDMALDPRHEHVYAMTDKKVYRLAVQNCSQYATCQECLESRDPYCGWCSTDWRCSLKSNCSNGVDGGVSSWLPYNTGQCPKVVGITSTQAQKLSASTLLIVITVQSLPQLQTLNDLQCAFSGYGVTRYTDVTRVNTNRASGNSTVKCETPTANLLPPFPTGKDHIVMNLSLVSGGRQFLSVSNFTFYDCSTHNTCTLCTKSSFPCTWCVENHRCTSDKEACESDVLITGKHVHGNSDSPGPEFCPRIESDSTEILISSGSEKRLLVRVENLQDFQSHFKCYFNFNGGVEGNASLVTRNHQLYLECDPVLFQYSGSSPYLNVPFSILWGPSYVTSSVLWGPRRKPLDNPEGVQVRIFKCSRMASNCGLCRAIDVRHECGWCPGLDQCSTQEDCQEGSWLWRHEPCPNPTIDQIRPSSGPLHGGTHLTVQGENFGVIVDDTTVIAGGIPCAITHYIKPSAELVCVTGPASNVSSGPVVVTVSDKYTAESILPFTYVHPTIHSFRPNVGPQSGGTLITIYGQSLDSGSSVSVVISNDTRSDMWTVPCDVISRLDSGLICITGGCPLPHEANQLLLTIDRATVLYTGGRFEFVTDPVVSLVEPEKTIFSGGTKITVTGERLNSVSNPKLVVYLPDRNVTGPCEALNSEQMICTTPALAFPPAIDLPNPVSLNYGFILDDVPSLWNMSAAGIGTGTMLVFPNPTFETFEDGVKKFFYSKNEYLIINGRNLNVVLTENDFKVTIGEVDCAVRSISSSQLTCLPSEQSTIPLTASVEVHVGNSSFPIGALKYDSSQSFLALPIIIAVAVAAGICLLLIVIICVAYRRKSKESKQVVKHYTNQMNTLEASVAHECKEAFAELQTDAMNRMNDIFAPGGIPFRHYSNFCARVMFPDDRSNDHPVVRSFDSDVPSTEMAERGLDTFNQLIGNKTFLLIFIRVLEQQPDFTAREKANVASLLSIALQNRLEYQTDILKTLLADLIERTVAQVNPKLVKLLLRRTECVAEKLLTNWLTCLLYKFLRESAGQPLFQLFRAIKQQVEKGPVDAVTSEAKYSLSEDKLIRQHIDFQILTLSVVEANSQSCHEVKVLDCDTITQVKEKILDSIYKSTPFSSRPNKDTLDLEWRNSPTKVRAILQDEDASTRLEGDMRRLNTLAHYKVPHEGAQMALVDHRSVSMGNLALSFEKLPLKDGCYNGSLPHSQSLSMSHTINFSESNSRFYHLVKTEENENSKKSKGKAEPLGKKMVSEVYLSRLLSTKTALDQFVETLFETIFNTSRDRSSVPMAIKYLFDFLDDQALLHGINDPEVVHTWKSNSLPLRFWVNMIKNPDFIFDIHKSNIIDSCLSVVAQTFMDSCSMSDHKLTKDSPSSKLLYAKNIPRFKDLVISYYENIHRMPQICDREFQTMLREESRIHQNEFNPSAALCELYQYAAKYNKALMEELNADEFARQRNLSQQLAHVRASWQPKPDIIFRSPWQQSSVSDSASVTYTMA